MKHQYYLKLHREFVNKAEYIDKLAAKIIGKPYGQGEFKSIEDNGCIFSFEYNSSCHCHPEYDTEEHLIPVEWIDALTEITCGDYYENNGYDTTAYVDTTLIAILQKHKEKQMAEEHQDKLVKILEETNKRQAQEDAQIEKERKEFERLQKKFGETNKENKHSNTGIKTICGDCGKHGTKTGSNFNPSGSIFEGLIRYFECSCGNKWEAIEIGS